jgi:hypothetical protein
MRMADYPMSSGALLDTLVSRVRAEPFNAIATAIFLLAVLHTFAAARFARAAHEIQHRHDARARRRGEPAHVSVAAEAMHFLGEVEVVFGLWAIVLLFAITSFKGWDTATRYLADTVNYTEPQFVVVIMALASSRPILQLAESVLRRLAGLGGHTPAAWWVTLLTAGPLLGSFVTEPAAMTICALLLARRFYDLRPSVTLKYATLGLLFVNISVGGTLTHFAAPPILMVARPWGWDTAFMFQHFGVRAIAGACLSTLLYRIVFHKEFKALARRSPTDHIERPDEEAPPDQSLLPIPAWVTCVHVGFMTWAVVNAHHAPLFVGGFLFFIGFVRATAPYQSRMDLKAPLMVGFFLAGLVVHGGLQGWWIAPVLGSLSETPSFVTSTLLTAFNDNALITYLATLVPTLSDGLKMAVLAGAVTGGGLTVIANAPNPAGQAILSRFFDNAVNPLYLAAAAITPTLIVALLFRLT